MVNWQAFVIFVGALSSSLQFSLAIFDEKCPPTGSITLPHVDCTKYIVCDNGIGVVLECPAPLYFNAEAGLCDYPQNVPECIEGTRPPGGTPEPTTPPSTTEVTTTSQAPTTTTASTTTPSPPTTMATSTERTTTSPPSSTHWTTTVRSTTQRTTTVPSATQQRTTTVPSTTQRTTTVSSTTEPITETTSTLSSTTFGTTTFEPSSPPSSTQRTTAEPSTTTSEDLSSTTIATTPPSNGSLCPPTGIDKIPSPYSCSAYILCVNGVAIEEECADGLLFNPDPDVKECDFPYNVNCTVTETPTISTSAPTTPNPLPECPAEGVIKLPYPGNCSLYIICVEGFPVVQNCVSGTCFDPEELQCKANSTLHVQGSHDRLSEDISCSGTTNTVLFVPKIGTCNQFVYCLDNKHMGLHTCPVGHHFDFYRQRCVLTSDSSCVLKE